ncbi:hypothetical protein ACD591_08840 [Rufibacter glacialis]|uniref:Lipopolysaccharide biosynthesis protein n=1 Tax=Rufibacter glacialis TaxID=1259555 RepID=A0A5M8QBC8_9BACT|nr:hypothetical protein [Rufibacter glacialis]KAA6432458.1 hypothetical protein FOE74_15270 [Rufibacter glacialis]GGK78817.1 hypothetical protein GCM10011405_28380 [Rufibacter glacialis]
MIERVKQKLAGKKVLFISCKFYHYGEAVREKIESCGAEVTFYYERNTTLQHVLVANFFPHRLDEWQDAHYRKILKETAQQTFDYLIVIRGYKMQGWFVEELKERNPQVQTILYQWDSYKAWDADYRYLLPYFDRTLTFDYQDAAQLRIPYAPTFHTDEYAKAKGGPPMYDFIFCSNLTEEKYEFLKRFLEFTSQRGYRVHTHIYVNWFKYLKDRFRGKGVEFRHVSFRRLNRWEYFSLFCRSKSVVDFSSTAQTGITMRVIDALGSGKRVLTNNTYVTQEPGFDPRQVVIYNASDLSLPEYVAQEESFSKKDYSIDKWLDNLFFAQAE